MSEVLEGLATEAIAAARAQVVGVIAGQPVTRGELTAYFNKVADPTNWKLEIDKVVELPTEFDRAMMFTAVLFFTGSAAELFHQHGEPGKYRVMAVGYYAAVGP